MQSPALILYIYSACAWKKYHLLNCEVGKLTQRQKPTDRNIKPISSINKWEKQIIVKVSVLPDKNIKS